MINKRCRIALAAAALAIVVWTGQAQAWTETVLYSFAGKSDGRWPAGVITDQSGNLYGATGGGGGSGCKYGCGTVFKLAPDGTETVLYDFGNAIGQHPNGGLVEDSQGNLFGTTSVDGKNPCGTVFEVTQNGVETTLYALQCKKDGGLPYAGLVADALGNLYGTTSYYGATGQGTVFKVTPAGVFTLLYNFQGGSDGAQPHSSLIFDAAGNLYGTTTGGGGSGCNGGGGCGAVFELGSDGTEKVLYAFRGGLDGFIPDGPLIFDAAGNLYGTTEYGGGTGCNNGFGCGTVFEIAPDGTETVLSRFNRTGGPNNPSGGVVMDELGNLFGTSLLGGSSGCGTVFKIAPGRKANAIHSFSCGRDGALPVGPLLQGAIGTFYGTTNRGGKGDRGTVFVLKK